MNELASTLTGLADTFLSVPAVFVLLKSPVRLPSSRERSAGDKPRWSEKRIVPQLWGRTHQPYIRMYAGLLSVVTKSSTRARSPTGNRGACLTGLPGSQLVKISLLTASYRGVAVRRFACSVPVTSWRKEKVRFTFLKAPLLAGSEARALRKPTKCSSEVVKNFVRGREPPEIVAQESDTVPQRSCSSACAQQSNAAWLTCKEIAHRRGRPFHQQSQSLKPPKPLSLFCLLPGRRCVVQGKSPGLCLLSLQPLLRG